jgi:hypothetical protein
MYSCFSKAYIFSLLSHPPFLSAKDSPIMFRSTLPVLQPMSLSKIKSTPLHAQQREGVTNDPYEGASPLAGSYLTPAHVNEFRWTPSSSAFVDGVIDPFKRGVNFASGLIQRATSSLNGMGVAALTTLGAVVVFKAFKKERALYSTLALGAIGLTAFSGIKAINKATDKQFTLYQDGDWVKPAGTAAIAGIIGHIALGYSSNGRNGWQGAKVALGLGPRKVGSRLSNAASNIFHGVTGIPRAAVDLFGGAADGTKRLFRRSRI